jgi:hypothetical protein
LLISCWWSQMLCLLFITFQFYYEVQ